MGGGTGSTLQINPTGRTQLTMGLAGSEPYDDTTPYIVPLQTLKLNEDQRWQIVYDQATSGEGGRAIGERGPLVPLSFWVVIKEDTREDLVDAYNSLQTALLNKKGGTIAYKPENLGDSVLTTYYHYVQSGPPRVVDREGNRWDAPAKSDGMYTLVVEVEFLTQAIATSDPDSPVELTDLYNVESFLNNWVESGASPKQNHTTVQYKNVKGTMPALLRLLLYNVAADRFIIFKRDEGTLTEFRAIYEAEDASQIYPSTAWVEVADNDRGSNAYMRCLPDSSGNATQFGLRFTIENPESHKGRFAVFGVGYDDAYSTGVWTHQAKVRVSNTIIEGDDDWYADTLHSWQVIYVGEFELPPTELSDLESDTYHEGPYIEWYSERASGSSEFRLDAIILVYVSDSKDSPTALDIETAHAGDHYLLAENFLDDYGRIAEISHLMYAGNTFAYAHERAPRGDFPMLDPTKNTLLTFIIERPSGHTQIDDDLSSYQTTRYRILDLMEGGEATTYVADSESKGVSGGAGTQFEQRTPVAAVNLSCNGMFDNDDFICWAIYIDDITNIDTDGITYSLYSDAYVSNRYEANVAKADLATGWNFIAVKKSSFVDKGGDWSSIVGTVLEIEVAAGQTATTYWDYSRVEKADPGDADNPNATGTAWDFSPTGGAWTVTTDVLGAGSLLACLDNGATEKTAICQTALDGDCQFRARVYAKRDSGSIGIIWRSNYAAMLDIADDEIQIWENDGGWGELDSDTLSCSADTWYTIGVIAKGSTFRVYATATSNLSDDDDVFAAAYLQITVTDTTTSSGDAGVICKDTLGRFTEIKGVSLDDKLQISDNLQTQGWAIFRTIAPFME